MAHIVNPRDRSEDQYALERGPLTFKGSLFVQGELPRPSWGRGVEYEDYSMAAERLDDAIKKHRMKPY